MMMPDLDRAVAAPFAVGDRIVDRHDPDRGSWVVQNIDQANNGHWRITAEGSDGWWTNSPAAMFRPCLPGWREPPPLPITPFGLIDEMIPGPAKTAAHAAENTPTARSARSAAYRERALWWREVGALVAADLAAEQSAGLDRLADSVEDPAITMRRRADGRVEVSNWPGPKCSNPRFLTELLDDWREDKPELPTG
jgi:hypothetical protein